MAPLRPVLRPLLAAALLLGAAALAGALLLWWASGPAGHLLVSRDGAHWIWKQEPPSSRGRAREVETRWFRREFFVAAVPATAPLVVESLRAHRLSLNGRALPAPGAQSVGRGMQRVDLAPLLTQGANELVIEVSNRDGPPAVRARVDALDVSTDASWQASRDGRLWEPASAVWDRQPLGPRTLSAPASFARVLPWLLAFFAGGCAAAWLATRERVAASRVARRLLAPAAVRGFAIGAWALLALNNLLRLPVAMGFDAFAHHDYVTYVASHGRIPLAHEGLQMFQPPLFYVLGALWQSAWSWLAGPDAAARLLRVLPMLCGIAQIEIGYRAARLAWPEREDLQRVVTVFAGFVPVNVYASQLVGNEPLSGALTAALLLLCFAAIARPRLPLPRIAAGAGLLLGLALLAKVTAVLLTPVLALLTVALGRARGLRAAAIVRLLGLALLASTAVAGAYYARNWLRLGTPFVGGWDPARGFAWWQDPGYRVPGDLLHFGEALVHPVRIGDSFWDGLYASLWLDGLASGMVAPLPPWSWDFVLSLALLSLPLCVAAAVGAVRALRWPASAREGILLFALGCVASLVAALAALFLEVPVWSTAKSSYALGALPAFALLVAWGLDPPLRTVTGRVLVTGMLVCWLSAVYAAFWVR